INSDNGSIIATHELKNDYSFFEINPDGSNFVVPSGNNLTLYDAASGKTIRNLDGPTSRIYNPTYSANGTKFIGYNSETQSVFVWDAHTGEQQAVFNNIMYPNIAINPDGTNLATIEEATNSFNIIIWDISQHTQ